MTFLHPAGVVSIMCLSIGCLHPEQLVVGMLKGDQYMCQSVFFVLRE